MALVLCLHQLVKYRNCDLMTCWYQSEHCLRFQHSPASFLRPACRELTRQSCSSSCREKENLLLLNRSLTVIIMCEAVRLLVLASMICHYSFHQHPLFCVCVAIVFSSPSQLFRQSCLFQFVVDYQSLHLPFSASYFFLVFLKLHHYFMSQGANGRHSCIPCFLENSTGGCRCSQFGFLL